MLVVVIGLVSVACLVLGLVAGSPVLVWAAFGLALAGLAAFLVPLVRPRWETWVGRPAAAAPAPEVSLPADGDTPAVAVSPSAAEGDAEDGPGVADRAAEGVTGSVAPANPPGVLVIPGRRRFHAAGCRLVEGRAADEVHVDDALDEGFSPCSACLPDRSRNSS